MKRPRLLDYYRQFEAISPEEDSRRMKEKRDAEKSRDLELAPPLDLSRSEWSEPPDPEIVNAATFALRRSLNLYPENIAAAAVAARHDLPEEQIALGHGAGQLIQAAVRSLAAGAEVVLPWPSWSALPALILRSAAKPVPVPGDDPLAGLTEQTSAIVLCNPNDPTGRLRTQDEIRALSQALPQGVSLLLDEALIEWAGEEASCVPLVGELPNLLVFRSFSKAWALAGLRVGYVVGPPEAEALLSELSPGLGVTSPGQFGIVAALEGHERVRRRLQRRVAAVATEREHLAASLPPGFAVEPSSAHVVWLRHDALDARALHRGLDAQRVLVAHGADWNDEQHVRVTLRDRAATERLLSALRALATGA